VGGKIEEIKLPYPQIIHWGIIGREKNAGGGEREEEMRNSPQKIKVKMW